MYNLLMGYPLLYWTLHIFFLLLWFIVCLILADMVIGIPTKWFRPVVTSIILLILVVSSICSVLWLFRG